MLVGLFLAALPPVIAFYVAWWAVKNDANYPITEDES